MTLESLKNGKFRDNVLKYELNSLFGGQSTVRTSSSDTKSGLCSDVTTTKVREDGTKSTCKEFTCPEPITSDSTAGR